MQSWSAGSPPRGPAHWPALVAERKAAIEAWAKNDTPPALGPVPDIIDDPAIVMLWGITRESLDAWLSAESAGETKELKGFAASRGVVEGTARVVKSVEEISRLRDGDILVCQVTNPTWAPIFQKISAAVSDIGGSMSHAAIVARELLLRLTPLRRGGWLFLLVCCVALAISAVYELIEWAAAVSLGEDAEAFLAMQGDAWDTQKDMALAGLGALLAQFLLAPLHNRQLRPFAPDKFQSGESR